MFDIFIPDKILDSIYHLNLEELKKMGIDSLLLDIDNTLVPNFTKDPDDRLILWIEGVKNSGFKLCIVSNAKEERVKRFTKKLDINYIFSASKPLKQGFLKALDSINAVPSKTALLGDQIFTDVLGGQKLGIYTILVKPIDKNELLSIRLKRIPEKLIYWYIKKKGLQLK
jgi:uncharacterized protein